MADDEMTPQERDDLVRLHAAVLRGDPAHRGHLAASCEFCAEAMRRGMV